MNVERGHVMGLFNRKPKTPDVEVVEWLIVGGDDTWNFDIVGEASYQGNIAAAVNRHGSRAEREAGRVALDRGQVKVQPEPTNQYDPMALRVAIDGKTVGYVAKKDAERFAEICRYMITQVHGKQLANAFAWRATADGRVGWLPGASDLMYGVKLSLPDDFWELDD